jgi:hypothetical protein
MALRKTNEDASVAAQLIDDASLISHVANDPDVHLVKQGYRRKQQRHKEEVQKRIEKAEKWGDGVCEASIPELGY